MPAEKIPWQFRDAVDVDVFGGVGCTDEASQSGQHSLGHISLSPYPSQSLGTGQHCTAGSSVGCPAEWLQIPLMTWLAISAQLTVLLTDVLAEQRTYPAPIFACAAVIVRMMSSLSTHVNYETDDDDDMWRVVGCIKIKPISVIGSMYGSHFAKFKMMAV